MSQPLLYQVSNTPSSTLANLPSGHDKVAVVLNCNAKQVTDKVIKRFRALVPNGDLFVSHSLDEAQTIARQIVQKGYQTVLCGGGDGTLINTVNLVYRYIDEANEWRKQRNKNLTEPDALLAYPSFGLLKLGTGNGMANVVGATNQASEDVQKVLTGALDRYVDVDLIESEGQNFVFAGLGYDALVLNDYVTLKKWAEQYTLLRKLAGTAAWYLVAVVSRTVPKLITEGGSQKIRVINTGSRGYFMDQRRGDRAIPVEKGQVLFEGSAAFAGLGTSPYYGFGFCIYPFAGVIPQTFNLRVATIGPFEALLNLPSLWSGNFRGQSVLDFVLESVHIESDKPMNFQHSGDAQGMRQSVDFSISDKKLRLVDYLGSAI